MITCQDATNNVEARAASRSPLHYPAPQHPPHVVERRCNPPPRTPLTPNPRDLTLPVEWGYHPLYTGGPQPTGIGCIGEVFERCEARNP